MMTDEELDRLISEVEEQVKQLPDETQNRLDSAERKHRALVISRARMLSQIKAARDQKNIRQEMRSLMEYSMLMQYGHKNILVYNIMRARLNGFMWW